MKSIEDRLRLLEDEREISRTLYTYGHSIDYGLEDQFLDCWTDDARLQWGGDVFCGHQQLKQTFAAHTHAPSVYHKHFLVEPRIEIDGDRASVDSMFARLDCYPEGPQVLAYGRYLDRLVRCSDGRWRFSERLAEIEAMRAPPQAVIDAAKAAS